MPKNELRRFTQDQEQALGTYVYALWDPRDRKVFYIGMGTGARLFAHFDETDRIPPESHKAKHRRIAEIWAEDLDVRWHILRRNLEDGVGRHVEAAVIDALDISQNGASLNEIGGLGVVGYGRLAEDEVAALAATPVNPTSSYPSVCLFPVQNALAEGRDIYDATRAAWRVSKRNRELPNALAVGLVGGVSHGVFEIQHWEGASVQDKHQFVGGNVVQHELLNKSWLAVLGVSTGYWQRGNYLIVELDGRGRFRFLRGSRDRDTWISLV